MSTLSPCVQCDLRRDAEHAMANLVSALLAAGAELSDVVKTTVYVASPSAGTVTPISTATNKAGKPIKVGKDPFDLAITPNGKVVEVVNQLSNTVTPIFTATNRAGKPTPVGSRPWAVAITPDSRTAYVANNGSNTVTPVSTVTGKAGQPISVGSAPVAIAIMR